MKPTTVEIGQGWKYEGMKGRPLYVIALEMRPGCSTNHPPEKMVLWAIFRKGKAQPVHDMLTNPRWTYVHGRIPHNED